MCFCMGGVNGGILQWLCGAQRILPFTLGQGLILLSAAYGRLVGPWAHEEMPVSPSHLTTETLGLQMIATTVGSEWLWGFKPGSSGWHRYFTSPIPLLFNQREKMLLGNQGKILSVDQKLDFQQHSLKSLSTVFSVEWTLEAGSVQLYQLSAHSLASLAAATGQECEMGTGEGWFVDISKCQRPWRYAAQGPLPLAQCRLSVWFGMQMEIICVDCSFRWWKLWCVM